MIESKLRIVFRQYYFLLGILLVIALAELFPWFGSAEGPFYTSISVKYIAVSVIFFASGVTIRSSDLYGSFKQYKLHIFIQFFSFVITPLVVRLLLFVFIFPFGLDNWIVTGIVAVSCMPPAVSSAVILTKAAKGNEPAAIFNSALGSFLGLFLTPILLLTHVGLSSTLPLRRTVTSLGATVILPLVAGQIAQKIVGRPWRRMAVISEFALLFIIYTSFCDMFLQSELTIDPHHVLLTLCIIICIQLILMYLSLHASISSLYKLQRIQTEDVIAIVFCCTHKSLTLGLPLLKTLYGGYSHLSQISLPLLMYHPVQLILGALVSPYAFHYITKSFRLQRLLTPP